MSIMCLATFVTIFIAFVVGDWAPWTGFKGKTLWEWLELLGVPLTLAVLGYILQQQEQKRSREEAKEQREIAAAEAKDEILQAYFDRLSALLVDKNLLAIATKLYPENDFKDGPPLPRPLPPELATLERARDAARAQVVAPEQQELCDAAIDVIRARTLSILRRFKGDGERKASVIKFLIEAEVISKAKLSLRGADFSEADLAGVNLEKADLSKVNLEKANLFGANLNGANLFRANLNEADLSRAKLEKANLWKTTLVETNLGEAFNYKPIGSPKFQKLIVDNLHRKDASTTILNLFLFLRSVDTLLGSMKQAVIWSPETKWPLPEEVAKARNIPDDLKKQLRLAPYDKPETKSEQE